MAGIRRITINSNPLVGDQGAKCLAEILKDDLWVKGKLVITKNIYWKLVCIEMISSMIKLQNVNIFRTYVESLIGIFFPE